MSDLSARSNGVEKLIDSTAKQWKPVDFLLLLRLLGTVFAIALFRSYLTSSGLLLVPAADIMDIL